MFEQIIDHAAQAVGRLTTQFKNSVQFKAIMTAWGTEIQALEDAIFAMTIIRDIDNATGATLDKLAALVGAPIRARTASGDDGQLREMIRLQIIVNKATGTDADLYAIASHITTLGGGTTWMVRHGAPRTWDAGAVGNPTNEFPHSSFVEVVALDGESAGNAVDNIITSNDARYFASLFKAVAPAGTRIQFRYRTQDCLTAFRFSGYGGTDSAGFGLGSMFNSLDK